MANYTTVAQVSKHMVTQWPKNHESYPAPYHHFESMTSKRMTLWPHPIPWNSTISELQPTHGPNSSTKLATCCLGRKHLFVDEWPVTSGDHKRCQMSSPICNTSYDFVILLRQLQTFPWSTKNILPFYLSCHEGTLASGVAHIFYTFAQLLKLRAAESQGSRPLWITAKSCIK